MLRRVVNPEPPPKLRTRFFAVGFKQGLFPVRIGVVHDEVDTDCVWVSRREELQELGEVRLGSSLRDLRIVKAALRVCGNKHVGRALPNVLVVSSDPALASLGRKLLVVKFDRLLVDADDRKKGRCSTSVEFEGRFHTLFELVVNGRDAPYFFPATVLSRRHEAGDKLSYDQHRTESVL